MPTPVFRQEEDVRQIKISRPGSSGYALFRMVFDPERGESHAAVMGIHEHPAGIESIPPHYHREVEETVYIVTGEGIVRLGTEPRAMEEYSFAAGSCWYVPAGAFHQIRNTGSTPIKMVVSYFRNDGKPISHKSVSEKLTVVVS
jgi:mannose-6-phosphate isomerase-like protein (cupin superfamily)